MKSFLCYNQYKKGGSMKVKVGVSNKHIHLSVSDYKILFKDKEIEKLKDISQPGQFASTSMLTVVGPNGASLSVRLVGPTRDYSQLELSITDCISIGLKDYVIKESGYIDNAPKVSVYYDDPNNVIKVPVVVAMRHLHLSPEDCDQAVNENGQIVEAIANTKRSAVIGDIVVRMGPTHKTELHLDTDEANAFDLHNGDEVEILPKG